MSDNENEDTEITTSDKVDKKNLDLVFSASNDIKNEMTKTLIYNSDQILKTLNLLLIFAGIYATFLIFICNRQQNEGIPILWPAILSGIFLTIAFIRSIIELFPIPSLPKILPKEIYDLTAKKYEESLQLIISTYLRSTNKIWISSEEKNFSRQQIVLFILISVVNFLLFGIYCIFNSYEVYLNILAIIFSIGFMIFYLWFIKTRRTKLNELKYMLEN